MTSDFQSGREAARPDDIEERVLKVIATTKRLPRESISADSTFESLGIDSLDRLNILFDLESEFDIQINDEEAKKVENIHQMVAGVRHLVEAKESGSAEAGVSAATPAGVSGAGEVRPKAASEGEKAAPAGSSDLPGNPASSAL